MTPAQIARESFISMVHKVWHQPEQRLFDFYSRKAEGYSAAMKDILGIEVWYEIVKTADRSFPEDVPVCAGIPLYPKNHQPEPQTENNFTDGLE
jgi:hypothetical protein